MESYNFLNNEEKIKEFCEKVLPIKHDKNLFLFVMVGARRKYLLDNEKDHYNLNGSDMLDRVVLKNSDFESVKRAILRLSIPQGTYTDKVGKILPHHCLTVYMTVNWSCGKLAAVNLIKKLTDMIYKDDCEINVVSQANTEIHKSIVHKATLDLDVDPKGNDDLNAILMDVKSILGNTTFNIVKTRTGAHVLIKKDTIDKKIKNTFYEELKKYSKSMEGEIEISNHCMVPVPGCYQGGHIPYIMS
jgi:hypothetical protein